jgi:hypothetical protein
MDLETKSKLFSITIIIAIILVVAFVLIIIFNQIDWTSTNHWLSQSITTLNIGELIIIICVCVILFGGSK